MSKILKYKKEILIGLAAVLVLGGLIIFASSNVGTAKVKFEVVEEKVFPRKITNEILPEYRSLERAMACIVKDQVYVIVTRGEKPTSGYEVAITKLKLETKSGKSNLKVYANFIDPQNSETLPQVVTYPAAVCKAGITGLPDTIELIPEYVK